MARERGQSFNGAGSRLTSETHKIHSTLFVAQTLNRRLKVYVLKLKLIIGNHRKRY